MSIQIITGFSLNSIEPIDTRIVASGSTGRDAIPYKYQGLRIFDLSNNRPYVYIGATWSVEVSDQVLGATGSIGKFTSSNTISDSNIYQVGSNIGINTSNPLGAVQFGPSTIPAAGYSLPFVIHKAGAISGLYVGSTVLGHNWYYSGSDQYFNNSLGSSNLVFGYYGDITIQNKAGAGSIINSLYISPLGKVGIGTGFSINSTPGQSLVVNGTASATGFVGSGAGLTNISPSSISNQILLSAGSSVTASNVVVTNVITNAVHYPTFVSSGSSTSIKTNTSGLSYNPSTNALNLTGTFNSTKLVVEGSALVDLSVLRNTNASFASSTIYLSTTRAAGTTCLFMWAEANSTPTFKVFNNGNVQNTNNSYLGISDIKLKENIVNATPKLDKLMQVRVVNYNFKENSGYESFKQIGVIAQEIENIFPGLVEEIADRDEKGKILETTTKSVKYSIFVPMLVKAIQEQQAQIEELKSQVASLINK